MQFILRFANMYIDKFHLIIRLIEFDKKVISYIFDFLIAILST